MPQEPSHRANAMPKTARAQAEKVALF